MLVSASGRRFRLPTPCGGDEEDRTPDPLLARQVLSQLSYTPIYRASDLSSHVPHWKGTFLLAEACAFQIKQRSADELD